MRLFKKILVMIALLGGVVGFLYWDNRQVKQNTPVLEVVPVNFLLSGLTLESLKRISIVRPDGSWSIVRAPKTPPPERPSTNFDRVVKWQLTYPDGAAVVESKLRSVITSLAQISPSTTLKAEELEEDQTVYGLEPPAMVLTVHTYKPGFENEEQASTTSATEQPSGEKDINTVKHVLSFGSRHPVSGRRYLQVEGDSNIYLIENHYFDLLNIGRNVLRDTNILPIASARITTIVAVREAQPNLVFIKNSAGAWSVSDGTQTFPADQALMSKVTNSITSPEARSFFDDANPFLPLFGLKIPKLILGLTLKNRPGSGASTNESPIKGIDNGANNVPVADPEEQRVVIQLGEGVSGSAIEALQKLSEGEEMNQAIAKNSKGVGYYAKITGENTIYELKAPFFIEFLKPIEFFKSATGGELGKITEPTK